MSEIINSGMDAPQEVERTPMTGLEETEFRYGNASELEDLHPVAFKFAKAGEVNTFFKENEKAGAFLEKLGFNEATCDKVTVKKISWGKEWYEDKDKQPSDRKPSQPFDTPRATYRMRMDSDGRRENVYVKVFLGNNETQEGIAKFLENESTAGNKGVPESIVTKVDDAVVLIQKEVPGRSLKAKFRELKDTDNAEDAKEHIKTIAKWLADFHQSNSGVENLTPNDMEAESDDFNRYLHKIKSLYSSDPQTLEALGHLEQSMPKLKEAANKRSGINSPSHNNFHPEHVYLTDNVDDMGVIGWSKAVKGSPAKDLAIFMNQLGYMGVDRIDGVDLAQYFLDEYKSQPHPDIDASLDVYRILARLQTDKNINLPSPDDSVAQAKFDRTTSKTKTFLKERVTSLGDQLQGELDSETATHVNEFVRLTSV